MGKKVHPFLLRTEYYPSYKLFYKTPFNFKYNSFYNSQLYLDIILYLKKIEKNIFLILDIKLNIINYNKLIIYIYIPFKNKFLNIQTSKQDITLLNDKINILKNLIKSKYNKIYFLYFDIIYSYKDFNYINYIILYIKKILNKYISFKIFIIKFLNEIKNLFYINNYKILYGIKLKITGRINGSNLSKQEEFKFGIIPLHTIFNNIKYKNSYKITKFGSLGFKSWIFLS
uniref:30S ribosomal protein S3 n=1 Tax=Nephromyces sp. ex Molgula occidentalis TaxID=2544991 RepID=A0A5C1H7L2_9APIC|nr:30S ribosomal protein S3 [Nephromyces sp. ex Molgula occidentalis]